MERHFQTHKWPMQNCWVNVHEGIAQLTTLMVKGLFNKVLKCNFNVLILVIVSLPFIINMTNLTILSFVFWFRILSQYGVGIVFLLSFHRVMQYPSKFQGECKYPKMMQVLHLNSITSFTWTF
jgi:hypothetical protein